MEKILKNLKRKITVLAVAMIAIQPVLVGGMMMPANTQAAVATSIVISEIQDSQGGTNQYDNEFVELYNPTASAVDMSAIKLHIRNSAGTDEYKALTFTRTMIPANGFFLIAATPDADNTTPDYATTIGADATYTTTGNKLVSNGDVYISNSETPGSGTIYDKVGWGSQSAGGFEGTVYSPTIPADQSIERKANASSTTATMVATDATKGNAWDTDVNSVDFVARTAPHPQNSLSAIEDIIAPTVTVDVLTTKDATPTLIGTVSEPATVNVTVNGKAYVAIVTGTSWTVTIPDADVLSDGPYIQSVVATDSNGNVSSTVTGALTIDTTAPSEVTDLTATGGNNKVTLDWTNPVDVDGDFKGVNIYRNDAPSVALNATPVTTETYEDTTAANGTTYTYIVKTVDTLGNESLVGEDVTVSTKAIVLSPVVTTVVPAVATVVVPETVTVQDDQFGGASSDAGEVKADTTIKADEGNKDENKDDQKTETKEKKNIPLWGIIFLLVLAGIGGYLFYSQSPETNTKSTKKK